jgi:hypothetical protein
MKRLLILAAAIVALAGCYAQGGYVYPRTAGAAVRVTVPPPPLRDEPPLVCGYNWTYMPGYWDWDGFNWFWRPGRCAPIRRGYVFVPPYWSGGLYYRGHWAPAHRPRYVPPPAPSYQQPGAVPPPAPSYQRPGYVPPPAPAR